MSYFALILLSLHMITMPMGTEFFKEDAVDKLEEQKYSECMDYDITIKTHFNYYYELLVDKHRPDLLIKWEQVASERDAINKKLKEFNNEKQKELYENISEDWYHKHALLQEHFLSAVKDRDGEKIKKNIPHILTLKKSWNLEMKELMKES